MFKNIQFFFCLCIFIVFSHETLSGKIIECQRLHELLPLIDNDTLVVFNINNVLTVSSQDAGSTPWAEEHIAKLMEEKNTSKPHATNLFIPLWHDVLIATDVELFDPDAEAIVHHLQKNGIKVMALTNRYIEMAYPTHRQLRSVGIDFAKNPPHPEDCPILGIESPAKFVEGVLFNGLINFKGDTLAAFLKQINYFPKKLIYIEDKPKHLAQVDETITALGITFVGIHFGALELQRQSYRPELAALQVKFHQDILDDASAKKLCYSRKGNIPPPVKTLEEKSPTLSQGMRVIKSFEELNTDLFHHTLVVTELDHVLWNTQGSIGARSFLERLQEKYLAFGDTPEAARVKAERLFEKIQRRAQAHLIETTSVAFFNVLSSKQCWSVAITYRPLSLLQRTDEQAKNLGFHFNSPFAVKNPFQPQGIICPSQTTSQYKNLEVKLSEMTTKPSQLLAISSNVNDLVKVQEIASRQNIPFQGRLLSPVNAQQVILDDEILTIELEYLDHLLTNAEADFLLKNK